MALSTVILLEKRTIGVKLERPMKNTLGIPNTMAREAEEQHVSFTSVDADCQLSLNHWCKSCIHILQICI